MLSALLLLGAYIAFGEIVKLLKIFSSVKLIISTLCSPAFKLTLPLTTAPLTLTLIPFALGMLNV